MRIAQLVAPQRFDILDAPAPTPADGEALVRLQRLSVCGSDMRYFDRVLPEEQYPVAPGRPCHECAGVVEESRSPDLRPGQRVIVLPPGSAGLAEYVTAPAGRIVPVPDDGDLSMWLMCQHMGTVMYSCGRMGSVLGQRVVVLGQGPIGLNFTLWLARGGARQVIVTDLHDDRLAMARTLGATHTINAATDDVPVAVAEATGGAMADVAIEAAGEPETVNMVAKVLRLEGKVVLFGQPRMQDVFPVDYDALMGRMADIVITIGGRTAHPTRHLADCVALVERGRLDLSHLVTHTLPFAHVQRAFHLYSQKPPGLLKVVLEV